MSRSLFAVLLVLCVAAPAAEAARFKRSKNRIPGRYIVMLNDDIPAADVDRLASVLARQHQGKVLGTMKHAMRGFGVQLTEAQARALMYHPFVAQVEEDAYGFVSREIESPSFDFASAARTSSRVVTPRAESATACPRDASGAYFVCWYANDEFWFLDRIDNSGLLYGTKAYAYNSMGTGVRAYVVDSGVWFGHTEFDTRVEAGANMTVDPDVNDPVGGTNPVEPAEEEPPIQADYSPANDPCNMYDTRLSGIVAHGTAVASLLAGNTSGVAKNATIVPVKVISCNDGNISQLAVARGLDWIQADMATRQQTNPAVRGVVNMSLFFHSDPTVPPEVGHTYRDDQELCEDGQGGFTNCLSALEHEVNELVRKNIPVVTSANNQNSPNCTTAPARMGYGGTHPTSHHTITVGASDYVLNANGTYTDVRWTTEFFGSNHGPCVSIFAPGARMRVAIRTRDGSAFRVEPGGTSFASALVAGAVARLLQWSPTLSAQQVWTELETRALQRSVLPADFDPSAVTNRKLLYIRATE